MRQSIYSHEEMRIKLVRSLGALFLEMNPMYGSHASHITMRIIRSAFNEVSESSTNIFIRDMIARGYLIQNGSKRSTYYTVPGFVLDRIKGTGAVKASSFYVDQLYMMSKQRSITIGLKKIDTSKNDTINALKAEIASLKEALACKSEELEKMKTAIKILKEL